MISKDYIIVDHILKLDGAFDHVRSCEYLAFDTETTGLNVRKEMVIGFSFSGTIGKGYYVPFYTWNVETEQLDVVIPKDKAMELFHELAKKELLMWNGSFDIRIVKNDLKVDLTESLMAEVMLMKHTIAEEGDFALKKCAILYQDELGLDMETAANEEQLKLKANVEKNGGSTTKVNYEMYKADLDVMGIYACADADLTLRLAELFMKKLEEEGLEEFFFDDEVMPLYKYVTIPMEDKGVKLNLELIKKTRVEIEKDIITLERDIIKEILSTKEGKAWHTFYLDKNYPVKTGGNFSQGVCKFYGTTLPTSPKTGKFSTAKKGVLKLEEGPVKDFLLNGIIDEEDKVLIQKEIQLDKEGWRININSKPQLSSIVFDFLGVKPLSRTKLGSPQFNDAIIQHLETELGLEWARLLGDYNKLIKIRGSYIDRFLDSEEDGYFFFYYKQHGTVSGRFSSDAQQLPRPKEEGELSPLVLRYNNLIRSFFISEEDRVFIDLDYESLEPHIFSHVSNDEGLRDIFRKGHDFYSTIAIKTEKLEGMSADKKADNYLGLLNKPLRQTAKAYSLGVPYGMTPFALSKTLDVPQKEAQVLYDGYLNGFPELKKWMADSKSFVQKNGYIATQTGRVRHLPKVKEIYRKHGDKMLNWKYRKSLEKKYGKDAVDEVYRDYKNGVNNARNVQIQGLSASIVNRAMIAIAKDLHDRNVDAWICGTVHDQIIVNASKEIAAELAPIIEFIMCNTVELSVTLKAPADIGTNWRDTH